MPIKVYVIDMGRRFLYFQWTDPATRAKVTRSSKMTRRREAERAAGELENDLNRRRNLNDGSMPWSDFRNYLSERKLSGMATKSEQQVDAILNRFEESQQPKFLRDLNTAAMSDHVAWLREQGRAEDTIKSHMRNLKTVSRWAFDENLLPDVPKIPKITRAKKGGSLSRGRPLSPDEVDRYAAAAAVNETSKHAPESWANLIRGLDVSGLRLGESLVLSWDDPELIMVDLSDPQRPKLRIPSQHEKSHAGTLFPMSPDFAEFLMSQPGPRTGYVFNALHSKGQPTRSVSVASHVLSDIGRASGVLVHGKQHCTAHDLRRSFGFRWAMMVMPAVLKELMRHESIETTMKYYMGQEANRLQDVLYAAWDRRIRDNTLANTERENLKKPRKS